MLEAEVNVHPETLSDGSTVIQRDNELGPGFYHVGIKCPPDNTLCVAGKDGSIVIPADWEEADKRRLEDSVSSIVPGLKESDLMAQNSNGGVWVVEPGDTFTIYSGFK